MKKIPSPAPASVRRPTESEIRAKAHELYIASGWLPGRDLDNWLAAEAFLGAHPARDCRGAKSKGCATMTSFATRRSH